MSEQNFRSLAEKFYDRDLLDEFVTEDDMIDAIRAMNYVSYSAGLAHAAAILTDKETVKNLSAIDDVISGYAERQQMKEDILKKFKSGG